MFWEVKVVYDVKCRRICVAKSNASDKIGGRRVIMFDEYYFRSFSQCVPFFSGLDDDSPEMNSTI